METIEADIFNDLNRRVDKWAKSMKLKLGCNAHKGNRWEYDDPRDLLARVREELDELEPAIHGNGGVVRHEAADVANMAMMVADAYEALDARTYVLRMGPHRRATPQEGRDDG